MDKANQPSKPVRIFIVEDEHRIARFLQIELEHEGFETETEENGTRAYERIMQGNFDLVLLDVMLPGMDGLTICKRVREVSSLPIIMLTAKDEVEDKVAGLDIGADDYMTKPFGILELSARVRNLLKRVEPAKEEVSSLTIGEVSINRETREVIACGDRTELTLKEFELLTYLMEHINRVVTRDELLDHIWGYDYDGETRTLDMHIKTLRQKLHDAGAQIKTVRGVGYRFLKEKEAGK